MNVNKNVSEIRKFWLEETSRIAEKLANEMRAENREIAVCENGDNSLYFYILGAMHEDTTNLAELRVCAEHYARRILTRTVNR